jgi:hypothetical protein
MFKEGDIVEGTSYHYAITNVGWRGVVKKVYGGGIVVYPLDGSPLDVYSVQSEYFKLVEPDLEPEIVYIKDSLYV